MNPEPVVQAAHVQLSPLAARYSPRLAALLSAELRVALKGARWWWYLVAVGLIAAGAFAPANLARFLLLAAWLWPLPLWSALGTREVRYHSGAMVFSAPRLHPRQLPVLWLSGCVVAVLAGSGVAMSDRSTGCPRSILRAHVSKSIRRLWYGIGAGRSSC